MVQKLRQHQGGAAAAASRASSVVAMTPSLIMRLPSQQATASAEVETPRQVNGEQVTDPPEQDQVSSDSSRETSEHPSLMSSELSTQVRIDWDEESFENYIILPFHVGLVRSHFSNPNAEQFSFNGLMRN